MITRGVFFVVLFWLLLTTTVSAEFFDYKILGTVQLNDTKSWNKLFNVNLDLPLTNDISFFSQLELEIGHIDNEVLKLANSCGLVFESGNEYGWKLYLNSPNPNFRDEFRLIHRNNYTTESLTFTYNSSNWRIFLADNLLLNDEISAYVLLSEYWQEKLVNWQITSLQYDTGYQWKFDKNWDMVRYWGNFHTGAFYSSLPKVNFQLLVAHQKKNVSKRGIVETNVDGAIILEAKVDEIDNFLLQSDIRYIGHDFFSPLTHRNRFRRNRKGIGVLSELDVNDWKISFRGQHLYNTQGNRWYPRSSLTIRNKSESRDFFTTLRMAPTQRLYIGQTFNDFDYEWRIGQPHLRLNWEKRNSKFRIAYEIASIYRLEYRYQNLFDMRLVYKYDLARGRSHYFCSLMFGDDKRWLELTLGESDRGLLNAKFDIDLAWKLSWGLRW